MMRNAIDKLVQQFVISSSIISVCFKWFINRFKGQNNWFPWGIPKSGFNET